MKDGLSQPLYLARLCFCFAFVWICALPAQAQFGSSPGALSRSHKGIDCKSCHVERGEISSTQCLGCHTHKKLKDNIRKGKGLHSRSRFKSKSCSECHMEHKGANAKIIDWRSVGGQTSFDHGQTGYELQGAHTKVDCRECHTQKYKKTGSTQYIGLGTDCKSCHEDTHGFQSTHPKLVRCSLCHNKDAKPINSARGLRFKHEKFAEFPLQGQHRKISCQKCHKAKVKSNFKYSGDFQKCASCHDDVHQNVYTWKGRDCNACHSVEASRFSKSLSGFRHERVSSFALKGQHKKLACNTCHKAKEKSLPKTACKTCHQKDSIHVVRGQDRFPKRDCIQCHQDQTRFSRVRFNHKKRARMELQGKHAKVKCTSCHRATQSMKRARVPEDRFEKLKSGSCIDCHAHKNAHGGQYNSRPQICISCHKPGVKEQRDDATYLDHSEFSDRFRQLGKHRSVRCTECHGQNMVKAKPASDCISCHQDKDVHKSSLGTECEECHIEGAPWDVSRFTHSNTGFQLDGAHQEANCKACHQNAPERFENPKRDCIDCHSNESPHTGARFQQCGDCHTTRGDASLFKHGATGFRLEGKHAKVDCQSCHQSNASPTLDLNFGVAGTTCGTCHDNPHGIPKESTCAGCHSTESFTSLSNPGIRDGESSQASEDGFFTRLFNARTLAEAFSKKKPSAINVVDPYHNARPFSLNGSHAKLDCKSCHSSQAALSGTGPECATCHQNDDIHANSFGPNCGDCHTQNAFTLARFNHQGVGFPLTGSHRMLDCKQCHTAGNAFGLSPDCVSCHIDDAFRAQRTAGQEHADFVSEPCTRCHSTYSWMLRPFIRRRF